MRWLKDARPPRDFDEHAAAHPKEIEFDRNLRA